MKIEIFKIQVDITGKNCLIYNEDKSSYGEFALDASTKKFMNGRSKVYVECYPHKDNSPIEIIGETSAQNW